MNLRFLLSLPRVFILLPFILRDGKRVRKSIPSLPEASEPAGIVSNDSTKTLNILFLGESTVAGVGVDKHKNGFAGSFARALSEKTDLGIQWQVVAKSGYNAQKVRKKLLPKIPSANFDLIVIGLGGNDTFEFNSPTAWKKQMEKLISELQSRFKNTPIFFADMPPIRSFPAFTTSMRIVLGNHGEILGQQLLKITENIPLFYFRNKLISFEAWNIEMGKDYTSSDFFSDGVHPSELTYQIWAEDFADFVHQNLKLS